MTASFSKEHTTLLAATDLAAAGTGYKCFGQRMEVREVGVRVTTTTVGTSAIVTFYKRVTHGSATGAVTIGTVTVPAIANTNSPTYLLRGLTTVINANEELYCAVTTTMGTSGNGDIFATLVDTPERAENNTNVTVVTV